jgi:hypothetical protein
LPKQNIRRMARTLLASTCLTVAANASTLTEPPDFSSTFGAPTAIPAGTTRIEGSLSTFTDSSDYLRWQGLTPGSILNVFYQDQSPDMYASYWHGSGPTYVAGSLNIGPNSITVPSDGIVNFSVGLEGMGGPYSLDFGSPVPEPGTLTTLGLGAAAIALAARRKRMPADTSD